MTVSDLTERLAQSQEEVRYLRAALTISPHVAYEGLILGKSEKVLIEALFSAHGPSAATYLRGHLDIALNRKDAIDVKTVDVVICRLRKKLRRLVPPIAISTEWGAGYFLTDPDRELLASRRHLVPGRQPPEQTICKMEQRS